MTMMLLLAPLTATATANDYNYNNDGSILPCRGCYLRPKTANTRVGNSSSILTQPGKKKQLVILMQYPDKAFLDPDPQSYWHNALNTGKISNTNAIGSLHQYFLDQSNGIFDVDSVLFDLNYFKYCFLKPTDLDFHELKLEANFRLFAKDLVAEKYDSFMYRDFQARNVMLDARSN